MEAAVVYVGAGQQHSGTHQLQMQPWRSGPPHVGKPCGYHLRSPGQLASAQQRGLRDEAFGLIRSHIDEAGCQCIGHCGDDHEIPEPAQQILSEASWILTDLDHLVHAGEDPAGVTGREGIHELIEQRVRCVSQQGSRLSIGHAGFIGAAE